MEKRMEDDTEENMLDVVTKWMRTENVDNIILGGNFDRRVWKAKR